MGMVVRSNLMAMNANRQLGMNNSSVSKSLEKLSSGFKINRAGDDASGLAISEKMKAQIKGLEQASSNSQDGISLVQTAEGALTEVHDMLNRMTELATKSANGTIQDEVDREAIQSEVDALLSEIDRIGDSTNFNGIKLLDGTMGSMGSGSSGSGIVIGSKIASIPDAVATYNDAVGAIRSSGTIGNAVNKIAAGETLTFTYKDKDGVGHDVEITLGEIGAGTTGSDLVDTVIAKLEKSELAKHFKIENDLGKFKFTAKDDSSMAKIEGSSGLVGLNTPGGVVNAANPYGTFKLDTETAATKANTALDLGIAATAKLQAGDTLKINGKVYEFVANAGDKTKTKGATAVVAGLNGLLATGLTNLNKALQKDGYKVTNDTTSVATHNILKFEKLDDAAVNSSADGLVLQIGDTGDDFNMVSVKVDDMRSSSLGVKGLDVSTADSARNSIQTIKDAINKVSTNRANLGALQNRLEHTINNLDVTAENMNAANSRIRDTDMAKQMMDYTKMNVLTQSAQAMLAQANQQPQSILQLLQ